jgi:ABC-type transport system substrate-binding protein
MEAAGIQVEQDPKDFGTWYADYQTLNYQCSLSLNQSYETPEVPLDFHSGKGPLADRSFIIGLNDPEIEEAINKTKSTFEIEERYEAVRDAQRLIYQKGPTLYPLVTPFGYTVYSNRLHNVATGLGPATNALVNIATWIG